MKFGVIFDFNGVIIDDERLHEKSWKILYKDKNFTEKDFQKNIFGKQEKDIFEYVLKRKVNETELSKLSEERINLVKEFLKTGISPTPGLLTLLKNLKNHNIPLAIGTSSRKPYLEHILNMLQITNYFDVIISAENLKHGKPHPEVFLKSAHGINIDPKYCVVFEDTLNGITAAKSAGMKVIALTTTHSKNELNSCDFVIPDFKNLSINKLEKVVMM